jgi:hypothetical protein
VGEGEEVGVADAEAEGVFVAALVELVAAGAHPVKPRIVRAPSGRSSNFERKTMPLIFPG